MTAHTLEMAIHGHAHSPYKAHETSIKTRQGTCLELARYTANLARSNTVLTLSVRSVLAPSSARSKNTDSSGIFACQRGIVDQLR